ncbi:ORF6N domain-containing protein [Lutibacter sp.]
MKKEIVITNEIISSKIYFIRGQKVMIDRDLALLYGIETKRLKEQVRRNTNRFPKSFMFELTTEEYVSLRTQIATLKKGRHSKYLPFVFTEHGILMLSSVLNSDNAIKMSLQILENIPQIEKLISNANDEFKITKKSIYLHCPTGFVKTKLANNLFERKLPPETGEPLQNLLN